MSKKINVLHIGLSHNVGGIETYIINNYRKIDNDTFHFDFLKPFNESLAFEDELVNKGSIVYTIPKRKYNITKHTKLLKKIICSDKYDYIHCHLLNYCWFDPMVIAMKNKKTKLIIHSHSSGYSGNNSFKEKILNSIGKRLVNNNDNKNILRLACSKKSGQWLFDNKQYFIMNNGIDSDLFCFNMKNRITKRKQYGIDENQTVIGCVTNFSYVKNLTYLLELIKELIKIDDNYKLLLIGDNSNINLLDMQYIIDNNLNKYIIFTGMLESTNEIYSAMDVYICPSIIEGMSISLLEAMANNLPCIISNNIKNSYISVSYNNIIFIDINKPAIDNINSIMKCDINIKKRSSSREFDMNYNIKNTSKELAEFYRINIERKI